MIARPKSMWSYESLDRLCEIVIGRTPSRSEPKYWGEGSYWLSIADMGKGRDINITKETITKAGADICGKRLVIPGTVVFSFKLSIGKVGIVKTPMYTNEAIAALLIKDTSVLDSNYLYYVMFSLDLTDGSDRAAMGLTLNKKKLSEIPIPLPPLEEQKRIAAILDKADAIRQKRKEAIALTEELLRSTFLDMFGDPVTNPKGWEIKKIENIAEKQKSAIKCGPFGSQLLISEFVSEGIPVYGIDNVQRNEFIWAKPKYITIKKYEQLKSFSIKSGDILISRTGTVGRTCIAPSGIPKSIIGPNLLKISLDTEIITPEYLAYALSYSQSLIKQVEKMSPGATVAVFNTANLKALKLAVPPVNIQIQFVKFIEFVQKQNNKEKKHLTQSDNLFNSLLQKAFRGEL